MSDWAKDNHQKAKDKFVLRLVHDAEKFTKHEHLIEAPRDPGKRPIVNPYPCAWATIPPDEPSAA